MTARCWCMVARSSTQSVYGCGSPTPIWPTGAVPGSTAAPAVELRPVAFEVPKDREAPPMHDGQRRGHAVVKDRPRRRIRRGHHRDRRLRHRRLDPHPAAPSPADPYPAGPPPTSPYPGPQGAPPYPQGRRPPRDRQSRAAGCRDPPCRSRSRSRLSAYATDRDRGTRLVLGRAARAKQPFGIGVRSDRESTSPARTARRAQGDADTVLSGRHYLALRPPTINVLTDISEPQSMGDEGPQAGLLLISICCITGLYFRRGAGDSDSGIQAGRLQ